MCLFIGVLHSFCMCIIANGSYTFVDSHFFVGSQSLNEIIFNSFAVFTFALLIHGCVCIRLSFGCEMFLNARWLENISETILIKQVYNNTTHFVDSPRSFVRSFCFFVVAFVKMSHEKMGFACKATRTLSASVRNITNTKAMRF